MSLWILTVRSLIYHWRVNATVALGVAAATAVLTGALIVGDSVRESLHGMTLDRLGRIDEVLLTDHFFRSQLIDELRRQQAFRDHYEDAVGVMLFTQATVELPGERGVARASNVLVVGYPTATESPEQTTFWDLGDPALAPDREPAPGEVILNRRLATELRAEVGDRVTLRLPKPEDIPAESPLGEKTDRIRSLPRLEVIAIVENRGLGRFSLQPSQTEPRNAYLALEQLQSVFREGDVVNAALVAGSSPNSPPDAQASLALGAALQPSQEDLGLHLRHPRLTFQADASASEEVIYDYYSLSSDRMILPPAVDQAAAAAFAQHGGQPVLTYLANRIDAVVPENSSQDAADPIPYSMVTAIDPSANFVLLDSDGQPMGPLGDQELALTSWAAEDLSVKVGDRVRLTYFLPESTHGAAEEASEVLTVKAIVPLTSPAAPYLPERIHRFDKRPTLANDPDLTPEVEGVTDQASIDDWEVPFVIDYNLIRPQDDVYWEEYATTPKAFVSLSTGRRLWGSRFGQSTSYRIPAAGLTEAEARERLDAAVAQEKSALGFAFRPIKRQQLAASAGNTPFDVLFLLLSFFIIAAALLLVILLFRLGFEQRARQAGLLLAVGWSRKQLRRLLMAEAWLVAMLGGAGGILIGLGYAALLLAALQSKTWWLGAISTPFLEFHYSVRSLVIGYLAGVAVSVATIFWSVWRARHVAPRQMLTGNVVAAEQSYAAPARWPHVVCGLLILAAVGLALSAVRLSGQAQAGAFLGAGAAVLSALMLWIWTALRSGGERWAPVTGQTPVLTLSARSAARNPTRSTLTIGLIAAASFLIVSMSAFRLAPTASGTGGFSLLAESSQPVFADLNSRSGREELIPGAEDELSGCQVFSFRVRPGDDASCGNLYRAQQPRVLGVPPAFVEHFDAQTETRFIFSASAAETPAQQTNPWQLLGTEATPPGEPIPVMIDKETALYSLRLHQGIGQLFTFEYDGQPIEFRVVGLLSLSVLHGNLLISEADFRRLFPDVSGYRYLLIETPPERARQVAEILEDRLGDQGLDATETETILSGLMALQNTYLRTFQTLGALGLLLGTFGLAAAQLRSVLERRGEMALLRACGFRHRRLARMVLLENVLLLVAGLGTGVLASLLAVLPHIFGDGADIPLVELASMLAIVTFVGLVAGSLAARATLRVPLLAALREER